jgi:hypothetical protein
MNSIHGRSDGATNLFEIGSEKVKMILKSDFFCEVLSQIWIFFCLISLNTTSKPQLKSSSAFR